MKIPSVLNELSIPSAASQYEAMEHWDALARLMQIASDQGVNDELLKPQNIGELELSDDFRWYDYLKKSASLETKELRRYLLKRLHNAPYVEEQLAEYAGDECSCKGQSARGFLLAYLIEGFSFSLNTDEWDTSAISVRHERLVENGDLLVSDILLPHASKERHLLENEGFFNELRKRNLQELTPGSWEQLVNTFPRLIFCASVEHDLKSLSKDAFSHVCNHLFNLNAYCEIWNDGNFSYEALPGKITPESMSRRDRLRDTLMVLCPDGQRRLFDWHARYTPGAGRLYFYPLTNEKRIIIGIIRSKLE